MSATDFRAFMVAPKTIVQAGASLSVANLRLALGSPNSPVGSQKTPYIYACFGDVILGAGTITNPVTISGGQSTFATLTLKTGCLIPIAKDTIVDLTGSANPALVLFFAT